MKKTIEIGFDCRRDDIFAEMIIKSSISYGTELKVSEYPDHFLFVNKEEWTQSYGNILNKKEEIPLCKRLFKKDKEEYVIIFVSKDKIKGVLGGNVKCQDPSPKSIDTLQYEKIYYQADYEFGVTRAIRNSSIWQQHGLYKVSQFESFFNEKVETRVNSLLQVEIPKVITKVGKENFDKCKGELIDIVNKSLENDDKIVDLGIEVEITNVSISEDTKNKEIREDTQIKEYQMKRLKED